MKTLLDNIEPRYTDNTTDITFSAYVIVDDDPAPPSDWTDDVNDPSWQTYERGNVFAVIITSETDDHVDSVWDIYDDDYHSWRHDSYTCEIAKEMLQSAVDTYVSTGGWVTI